MITQDALARAIDFLGAVEVTARIEGDELDKARYAFSAGRWHTATAATLLDFERYDTDGAFPSREDAALRYERDYPEAMAEMPSWWTPTQQFAWKKDG
jgi:HEAT repeat protein